MHIRWKLHNCSHPNEEIVVAIKSNAVIRHEHTHIDLHFLFKVLCVSSTQRLDVLHILKGHLKIGLWNGFWFGGPYIREIQERAHTSGQQLLLSVMCVEQLLLNSFVILFSTSGVDICYNPTVDNSDYWLTRSQHLKLVFCVRYEVFQTFNFSQPSEISQMRNSCNTALIGLRGDL